MAGPGNGTRTSLTLTANYASSFQPGGFFSPGTPPTPVRIEPPRRFDFAAGQNLQYTPRAYEPFGFPALRAFSNVELVRLAIETRKDQIERLDWLVRPRDGRKPRADHLDRIRKVEKFLRKPDGVTHFATWMRLLMEDLLVLDAPAIERRRSRGGELLALDVVDGATIKLLIDHNGRRPRAPEPAFQQIIKGTIWADLSDDEMIYAPRNPRPGHIYGYGPVEQTIVTINTILRRQAQQLAYFTDGTTPAGLINAPEGWTVDHLKDYQQWVDATLAGNQAERSKILWVPAGAKYQAFKESPIKDEFDEWLARVVCFAFSLPPTPFIKQMNRATSESDAQRATEEGLAPLQLWAKRVMDSIVQDDLGFPDLEFAWNITPDVDPKVQAEIHDLYLRNGTIVQDEVRDKLGLDPYPGPLGSIPLIYTGTGAVPLADMLLSREERAPSQTPKEPAKANADPAADDSAEDDDSNPGE
jgi:hypothetical protein